jgi:hypothetical protein
MPRFEPLTQTEIAELTTRRSASQVDLTEHKRGIEQAIQDGEGWGRITLQPSENVRAVKRRTTVAAKEMNRVIKWHKKSNGSVLIFRALAPGEVIKRARRVRAS